MSDKKEEKSKHEKELENDEKKREFKSCICEILLDVLEKQEDNKKYDHICGLQHFNKATFKTFPFILQTPYGHPYFTWGKVGTDKCFVTVFFKVIKVDCKKNCAVLQLLKPNVSLIDPDTNCVEDKNICDVDFLIPTKECVLVDLCPYTAIKFISSDLVKQDH